MDKPKIRIKSHLLGKDLKSDYPIGDIRANMCARKAKLNCNNDSASISFEPQIKPPAKL